MASNESPTQKARAQQCSWPSKSPSPPREPAPLGVVWESHRPQEGPASPGLQGHPHWSIENVLKEDARGSVVLGQVDAQLVPYIIDLQSMHQFRQDTGEWTHYPPHPTTTTITTTIPPFMAGCWNAPRHPWRGSTELRKANLLIDLERAWISTSEAAEQNVLNV